MRIAIFTDGFPPYISGVATTVVNQGTQLAARGHELLITSPSPPNRVKGLSEHNCVQIKQLLLTLRWPFLNGLWIGAPTVLGSFALLRRFKPDIVHLHTEGPAGLEGLLVGRLLGCPIVGNFNTLFAEREYLRSYHIPSGPLFRHLIWQYQRWFFNSCSVVMAPSRVVRDLLRSHGIGRKIEVLSNGTDEPSRHYERSRTELREQYGCGDTFNVLYVGRVSREKSLDIAVDAIEKVSRRYSSVRFIVIGDGNYVSHLRRRLTSARNRAHFLVMGAFPHDELMGLGLFRLGDVFLMPSKTETEGIATREAMSFGLPVIAVAANASAEVVTHGFNGFIATRDSSDEIALLIEKMLGNPRALERASKNAARSAKEYFVKHTVKRLEDVYSSITARKN